MGRQVLLRHDKRKGGKSNSNFFSNNATIKCIYSRIILDIVPNTDYNQYVSRNKLIKEASNFSLRTFQQAQKDLKKAKLKELKKMSDENVQPVDVGDVPTPGEAPAAPAAPAPEPTPAAPESNSVEEPVIEPTEASQDSFVDEYAVDVPDIPIPDEEPDSNTIEDEFEGAYKFAVLGVSISHV